MRFMCSSSDGLVQGITKSFRGEGPHRFMARLEVRQISPLFEIFTDWSLKNRLQVRSSPLPVTQCDGDADAVSFISIDPTAFARGVLGGNASGFDSQFLGPVVVLLASSFGEFLDERGLVPRY